MSDCQMVHYSNGDLNSGRIQLPGPKIATLGSGHLESRGSEFQTINCLLFKWYQYSDPHCEYISFLCNANFLLLKTPIFDFASLNTKTSPPTPTKHELNRTYTHLRGKCRKMVFALLHHYVQSS